MNLKNDNANDQLKLKIDLAKDTEPVYSEDGNMVFQEAVIFRKINRFLSGSENDSLVPISVFIDVKTKKVVKSLLPKALWPEFGYLDGNVEAKVEESTPQIPTMFINRD